MGNYIDDDPLKHDEIDVYVEEFEEYAATDTKNFYHKLSELWLSECSFTEYMVKAETKIKEESQRLANIFISSSQQKLTKIIDDQLLAKNQRRLLDMSGSGVDVLIRDEKLEDLSRLFRLMSRINQGLDPIAQMFQEYISRVGRDIFKKHADEAAQKKDYTSFLHFLLESYVVELIHFHNKMDTLVTGPFQNDATFHKALSNGFKSFVNLGFRKPKKGSEEKGPEVKTSQLFAYYCDEILRKRKVESLDDALEKVVSFVQFFSDKDIFIEEYRKQLAKRLLVSGYQDSEERTMIGKLKWFYRGVGDLYKLEKMLTDKSVAVDMKQEFNQFLEKREPNQPTVHFDLMVTVLTMGTWPINLKDTLKVLPVFSNAQQVFKEFYDTKHNRRILHWAYGRSTVQLEANFAKKKVLETSTYQACILLLFNDVPELSVKQIMNETGLDLEVVKRTLVSVSTKKFNILQIKQNSDGDVMSEDTAMRDQAPKVDKILVANAEAINESTLLEINQDFHHKQTKIKLPVPRVTEEEVKKTIVNVSNDRVWTLEATIVRVMKTRKTMKLQQLIQEVITQIKDRFQPDLRNIKTRVESLIERDYIKRAESDPATLEYVA
jgi:cullin 1